MRRIITLTALALGLIGGVASADRRGDRDNRFGGRDRVVNRDNRNNNNNWNRGQSTRGQRVDRGTRYDRGRTVVRVNRTRPVFRNGGFYFSGGFHRPYVRPVINVRYREYSRRPALIVENYDPVPGYIWMQGSWQWSGYEWNWVAGHYEVDQNYTADYDGDGYSDGYYNNY
jgi:hypothetical protein